MSGIIVRETTSALAPVMTNEDLISTAFFVEQNRCENLASFMLVFSFICKQKVSQPRKFVVRESFKMKSLRSFAYCQCYLSRNIFLHDYGIHTHFENEAQFTSDYEKVIPKGEMERALENVKQEINRRMSTRENVGQRMRLVQDIYKPLHLEVYKFNENLLEFNAKIEKVGPEVFSMPCWKPSFVSKFMAELKHFKDSGVPHEQPNSMNKHGINLDEIGFQEFFTHLRQDYIQPLARQLFQEPNLELDSHKAFVIKYAMGEDEDLAAHFDNAEITLNISLSDDYDGGELVFKQNDSTTKYFGYEHQIGHAILHRGSLIHEALPITSGERWNLIIWTRSSRIRQSKCPMCQSKPQLLAAPSGTFGDGFLLQEQEISSASCNLS